MALVLGMRKNQQVYVGGKSIRMVEILSPTEFKVSVLVKGQPKVFGVSEEEATEVLPDVMLSSGTLGTMEIARVVIEAPLHLKILRGHTYLKEKRNASAKEVCI